MSGLEEAYAQGLFDALTPSELPECAKEAEALLNCLNEQPSFSHLLSSPNAKKGQGGLSASLQSYCSSPKLKAFLALLGEKGRLNLLPGCLRHFCELSDGQSGVLRGTVYSVSFLDKASLGKIEEALSRKIGQPVKLHNVIDSALLGGIKVAVGGKCYDYALITQLNELKRKLENS